MTERSMFWSNDKAHGGPYTQDELRLLPKALFGAPAADEGVLANQLNELAVTSSGNNNVTVATGRALVDGTLYENDASLPITVTSPVVGTTGKRLVLRKDWTDGDVTATVISSADGTATLPALTQTDGATWEIPLASFTITTGGVIGALTDERELFWGPAANFYGDGSDGDVVITASNHVDLTRDMYYDRLTVEPTATLDTDGWRVFARSVIVCNGTIANLAGEGGGASSNLAAPAGSLGGGAAGGSSDTGGTQRGGGGGGVVVVASPSITGSGVIHADGAAAVQAGSVAGNGTAGTTTPPTEANGGVRIIKSIFNAATARTLDGTTIKGGGGGGSIGSGNGSSTTNSLGGAGNSATGSNTNGGGGGGVCIAITRVPVTGVTVRAAGGAGAGTSLPRSGVDGTALNLVVGSP